MLSALKNTAVRALNATIGVTQNVLTPLIRVAVVTCLIVCCRSVAAQETPSAAPDRAPIRSPLDDPAIDKKVDALLKKMTLEEKVGQTAQYSAGQPTGPGSGPVGFNDMLQKDEIGSLYNITSAREVNAYQHIAVEKSHLHIPLLFGLDVIHGYRTEFPIPLGLASTWDPQLVQRTARVAAREASAVGIRWAFSPMVDIARDARWGRMVEGFGEDPYLDAAMARAFVLGYQGEHLDAPDSVAACVKHYVGYGAAEAGRDYNSTEISEHTLREFYLPPFHAAIEAGSVTIMTAFNSLNGIPASANAFTIRQILRKEWGFRGIVDSDWTSIAELIPHGIANDPATAARRAFLAGVEMDMMSNFYHQHLAELVRSGQVPEALLDQAVRDILRVKFAMGLFEHPYVDESKEAAAMLQPESVELARAAAERSFVLLKNSPVNGGSLVLPLSADSKNVALIGPLADNAQVMLGSWSAQGRPEDVITLRAALTQKLGADHVHYAKGVEIIGGSDDQIAAAVDAAKQSDVAILALGENAAEMTGEAASRAHLGLPGRQEQLLEAIVATGKPVVLILFSGRPLTLPWAFEHVPSVLAAWFPGVQAGPALVRTLFGESNPTGKLVVSWPRAVGQEPLYYNELSTGRPAGKVDLTRPPYDTPSKYVSRYIDEQDSPQFPFGYGLTYTSLRYGPTQSSSVPLSAATLNNHLSGTKRAADADLIATAEITNTGSRAAEETVQVYVRLEGTSTAQPIRALKGFQQVKLAAGETQRVTFRLGPGAFAIWDDQNKYVVEPARVKIWISPDSAHGSEATLEIIK
ncbi:MAG TPA: beta-glucosidase BglX [Candidatus Acidoferrum sp.]|jgi:beta-glucosidase